MLQSQPTRGNAQFGSHLFHFGGLLALHQVQLSYQTLLQLMPVLVEEYQRIYGQISLDVLLVINRGLTTI